jgi:predicted nucleotidyltransferase component of viral defense system
LNASELVAEKIRAVYSRRQARDVYDLYFLMNRGISAPLDIINKKLSLYSLRFDADSFRAKLAEKKEIWHAEMGPLIVGTVPEFETVFKKIDEAVPKLANSL